MNAFQLPHPWWHFFFTTWIKTVTQYSPQSKQHHEFACSKCKVVYVKDEPTYQFPRKPI